MSFISALPGKKQKQPWQNQNQKNKKRFYKNKWFLGGLFAFVAILAIGGFFAWKTGYILNKISESDNSALKSLFNVLPVVGKLDELEGEDDGRINMLLLGMRGENVPGGGLLADTIIVVSLNTQENKVAMISIPRDLYVDNPEVNGKTKINAVFALGEENGKKRGLKNMKEVVGKVTGLPIHYAASINFFGFKQLIDAVGGIDVNLETPFYETHQFVEGKECGIEFTLPAGQNHLDGEKALCYARARENTSDFDRSKRQQLMLKALKDKLVSMGTLTDFNKVNGILDAIGDNVRTDMASYEMKNFYEKYASMNDAQIYQRVFENSEEGLLMVPSDAPEGAGYILIPRAGWDSYSQVQEACQNIFSIPAQSDIQPVKQYSRPAPVDTTAEEKNKKDDKKKKD